MTMKILLTAAVALFMAASLTSGQAEAGINTGTAGAVSGQVQLRDQKTQRLIPDDSGAVVWLVPLGSPKIALPNTPRRTYKMVQRNKQFYPHLLVVPLGSVVAFPNLDPWFHNVFSVYQGKRFDLGLYESGSEKAVTFNRLGVSYIFCNIHPEMMAVVLTVDTPFYAISNRAGQWSIPLVPPGRYRLHVWYQDATPAALRVLERDVVIGSDGTTVTVPTVPVAPNEWLQHRNLYGQQYDSGQLTPVY
jgi:plastocyanin